MDLAFLADCFLRIVPGVPMTLGLTALSVSVGLAFACLLAAIRLSGSMLLDWPARLYVFVFRGTPLAIQMFLIYFGLAQFEGVRTSVLWPYLREPFWCAFGALMLNTAAYGSEIVRGGLLAVPCGEVEAARACGMSGFLLFRRIVAPIALRRALPGYGNEIILMVKATSLASMVTLVEVTGLAARIISTTYRVFEAFAVAAAIYLAINFAIARAVAALEWWLSPHLRGAPPPAPDLRLAH
ncbi:ABC transporter permease [Elioraea sp.]|uniref:ABC transporter permease n=1 Tax=Elioraea sp. TaxID=2185103 RepID=UPI0021DEE6D6|nr:ABC transporter permease subunit [Elioraea sp.]GIX10591.1 MAG: nopaline transport system permease protein NocM [Elioraea sp.]